MTDQTRRPPRQPPAGRANGAAPETRRLPLSPTVEQALGAALARHRDVRALLAQLAPPAQQSAAQTQQARTPMAAVADLDPDEITEVTRRVDALERARLRPEQVSIGEIELHGPGGLRARIGGLSGWQVVVVLVLAAGLAGAVWYLGG